MRWNKRGEKLIYFYRLYVFFLLNRNTRRTSKQTFWGSGWRLVVSTHSFPVLRPKIMLPPGTLGRWKPSWSLWPPGPTTPHYSSLSCLLQVTGVTPVHTPSSPLVCSHFPVYSCKMLMKSNSPPNQCLNVCSWMWLQKKPQLGNTPTPTGLALNSKPWPKWALAIVQI